MNKKNKRINDIKIKQGGMTMAKYRIEHRYPYYYGCIPIDIWVVQILKEGLFVDKWVDVKGFDTYKKAEELLKLLQ